MSDCWRCRQSAEYKLEKLNAARAAAKLQANESGETMALIKQGCIYTIIASSKLAAGIEVFEYISKYQ